MLDSYMYYILSFSLFQEHILKTCQNLYALTFELNMKISADYKPNHTFPPHTAKIIKPAFDNTCLKHTKLFFV